jgi:hypothetical protein
VDPDFDKKVLGDSVKMRFVELDQKYFKKWVQRPTPASNETLPIHDDTMRDNTADLDRNIEMVFKETGRNELHEPQLFPKAEEENAIKNKIIDHHDGSNTSLSEFTTGSISSRLAEERSMKLLNIKESSEDEHYDHDENQESP